jgi:hypothetical protein
MVANLRRFCLILLAGLTSGCAVVEQLDRWSRPKVRCIDPREIGPDGLPNDRRKGFVNKFIIWSEVPVSEFYGQPYYTSGR